MSAVAFEINVSNSQGKTFTINVESSDTTIKEIKKKIFVEKRISIAEQTLVSVGKKLEDDLTLTHYQIKKESTIFLVLTPLLLQSFDIFIKDIKGRIFVFEVKVSDTIVELKYKIFDKIGIKVNQQRLIFNGKQLIDDLTIDAYGIQKDDTIHLTLRMNGGTNMY